MYRFLLLCFFVVSAYGCHHHNSHGGCTWRHKHRFHKDSDFNKISWDVVNTDRKIQRLCSANDKHITETYYSSYYQLSVSLPEYTEEEITVKIKHRVMLVQAVKAKVKVYSEVKILPEQVNPNDASWTFEQGQLTISIMYRVPLGTAVVECNEVISDKEIDVQPAPQFDARFGGGDSSTGAPLNEKAV